MNEKKRPGWAFWCVAAFIVAPLLYFLSVGPACWLSSRWRGSTVVSQIY
jgi:hypothetical protein